MKRGKKSRTWDYARAKLKRQFLEWQITRCEQCGSSYSLSFAHRYKRRFITTEEELLVCALLCVPCHQKIEVSGHENMLNAINEIIEQRNEQIESTT